MSNEITKVVIHPAVGVARVGNSPDQFFLGPEAPGEVPQPPGGFKDAEGRLKRQGARFRLYGLDAAGRVVREITANDAGVTWRVHLANRKAAWYQFLNAMDLGDFSQSSLKRNGGVVGEDRRSLVIDPGARSISGRDVHGDAYRFDSGTFMGRAVPLGELRTDAEGRLIVLGGLGSAGAGASGAGVATTFANNDGWNDDISDGPVRATVTLGGQVFEAEPAVVAVAPPNYGQGLYAVVTMYDLLCDVFGRQLGWMQLPATPSFTRDISPIFARLSGSQWVNQGFYVLFGQNSPSDFTAPEQLALLSDPSEKARTARQALFKWFRDPRAPRGAKQDPAQLPPFYGDTFGDFTGAHDDDLCVTVTQYQWLERWANGEFVADWGQLPPPPPHLEDVPLADQPHALDRAAMEDCLGGPFHPGCEITWIVRVPGMWKSPFRLNVLPEAQPVQDDYGPVLTPAKALADSGPLRASGPGTLTRWMAVPWHTDTASCLSGYDASTYLPVPTFWAARVPNQVLAEQGYQRLGSSSLPVAQRLKHFDYRQFWLRDLGASYQARINNMIHQWGQLGVVTAQPGPVDHAAASLPARVWVETGRSTQFSQNDPSWQQVLIAEHAVPAAVEEAPKLAARKLESEKTQAPVPQQRHIYRRDER